jgi:non-specific serine/threonine protein kinase
MAALVGQSLVRRLPASSGEPRFGMLETIRAFGLERLADSGEGEAVGERHLAYFAALAERAEPELTGPDQAAWLGRLAVDVDNLRAAFERAVARHDATTALRLGLSLWRFWIGRGLRREGHDWLERALAIGTTVAPELRARAFYRLGMLAIDRADYADALAHLEESLAISRALGNLTEVGDALAALGLVAADQGDFVRAQLLYEDAYAIRRDHVPADQRGVALSLFNLAQVARDQTDYERASDLYAQALAAWTDLGDQSTVAYILRSQGVSLRHMGDLRAAAASTGRALDLFRELQDGFGVGWATTELGQLALQAGELDVAGARFEEVLRDPMQTDPQEGMLHNWVEAIEGMAWIARRQEDLVRAARLFAAAAEFRRGGSLPFSSRADRDAQEAAVTELVARMGPAWDEAAAIGHRLTAREATDDALRWRQVD